MGSFIATRRHLRRALLSAALLLAGSGLAVGVGASFADVTVGAGNCIQTVGSSTGVTSTRSGNECVVKFTNVGSTTWTTPRGVTSVRALVVGGGASGNRGIYGVYYGSGGGGGEVKDLANLSVGLGAKTVTVGAGGQGVLAADNT